MQCHRMFKMIPPFRSFPKIVHNVLTVWYFEHLNFQTMKFPNTFNTQMIKIVDKKTQGANLREYGHDSARL